MSAARCPRAWEVEAARDRRLSGAALRAHAAHLAGCRECRSEREALDALARDLRAAETPADEVALRRLRQAMLERAYELSRSAARAPLRASWAAALVLIVLGGAAATWLRRAPLAAPSITVTAGAAATWTRRSAPGVEHVELGEGAFSLVVRRRPHDPRVIVRVPEGEIEDFGTMFDVRVHGGRTERVAVREGVVVFRRHGSAPLRLSAGMVWSANAEAQPSRAPAVASAQRAQSETEPAALPAPPAARASRSARVVPALRKPAVGADSATAAEDAAYLHVLALLHEHRLEEAKLAAALYLKDFPSGFRRVEMQRLAHSGE